MMLFNGKSFERMVMKLAGCIDYSVTPWRQRNNKYQRQVKFKFGKNFKKYENEIIGFQQKSMSPDGNRYEIEENIAIQGAFLGDNFHV
jgi:hypothetical protein